MKSAEIAKIMSDAHLQLGLDLEDSALAMGHIADAARTSGIGFESTAKSIMTAAKSLKFWGGTVASVQPLFRSFSASLKGIGREGLTPELLETFVSGLSRMQMFLIIRG